MGGFCIGILTRGLQSTKQDCRHCSATVSSKDVSIKAVLSRIIYDSAV
jgi:hypothetical protein